MKYRITGNHDKVIKELDNISGFIEATNFFTFYESKDGTQEDSSTSLYHSGETISYVIATAEVKSIEKID
jgi:hypothetical protein